MATSATRRVMSVLRHHRLRKHVVGSTERPRLAVFRSNKHVYAQVIDDSFHHTLAAASTLQQVLAAQCKDKPPVEQAALVGKAIGERAKTAGVNTVVFDRGGFKYHGCIKALADAAREAGLEF